MSRKTRPPSPRRSAEGKSGSGTPADRMLRAWHDREDETFAEQAEALIAEGRDGVLSTALRKLGERYEEEEVDEFARALTELAEVTEAGADFDMAQLLLLPVVTTGTLPDPAPLAAGLTASGTLPEEAETVFLADWREAEAIGTLSPVALRRVLLDVVAGRPPADLPPMETARVAVGTVAVLVGAAIFRAPPAAEDPDAELESLDLLEEEAGTASIEAFTTWRDSLTPEQTGGAMVLPPCAPSELEDDLLALLDEAEGAQGIEEILDFIEAAREEAGSEAIAARLAEHDDGLQITVLTEAGRVLDSRVFEVGEDDELDIGMVREALASLVTVIED